MSEKNDYREVQVLRAISALPTDQHPGQSHLVQLLDYFAHVGPNGTHSCLVLELLGPSVPDVINLLYRDERLPAALAKSTARQALLGIDFLAWQKIGHGGKSAMLTFNFLPTSSNSY